MNTMGFLCKQHLGGSYMGIVYRLALILAIFGAINWGLIGVFQFDIIATLFEGQNSILARTLYGLIGLCGLLCIPIMFRAFEEEELELPDNQFSNAFTNTNYQTEFGEEEDFSGVQKERVTELYENDDKK